MVWLFIFGLAHFDAPADADTDTTHPHEEVGVSAMPAHCNFLTQKTENHERFRFSMCGQATEHNAECDKSDNTRRS